VCFLPPVSLFYNPPPPPPAPPMNNLCKLDFFCISALERVNYVFQSFVRLINGRIMRCFSVTWVSPILTAASLSLLVLHKINKLPSMQLPRKKSPIEKLTGTSTFIHFYPVLSSVIQFYPVLSSFIQFYLVLFNLFQFGLGPSSFIQSG
jgi:hypothetical protein